MLVSFKTMELSMGENSPIVLVIPSQKAFPCYYQFMVLFLQ